MILEANKTVILNIKAILFYGLAHAYSIAKYEQILTKCFPSIVYSKFS